VRERAEELQRAGCRHRRSARADDQMRQSCDERPQRRGRAGRGDAVVVRERPVARELQPIDEVNPRIVEREPAAPRAMNDRGRCGHGSERGDPFRYAAPHDGSRIHKARRG
jgi:hypothetical protein